MAVSDGAPVVSHRRRNRRRRQDKPAITARLVLDDRTKGDVGIVSDDLFSDLFPHIASDANDELADDIHHIAVAPWAPNANPVEMAWSVVPVLRSSDLAHSTIQFSPSSSALQSFAVTLQQVAPSKLSSHSRSGIEILVLDVAPVPLETVFVNLESELTKRLENGEGTFYKDHPTNPNAKGVANMTAEERVAMALRAALGSLKVVHSGDLFPLPLPPHPVTHLPPNPGKIMLCEPVAQGILTESTKIILMRGRGGNRRQARPAASMTSSQQLNGNDDDEDGTNDQFFSAAEERDRAGAVTDDAVVATETETDFSASEQEEELSDDSMDEVISLEVPTLPTTNSMNSMGPGTPMTAGTLRGRKTNGFATPGSVFSNFTSTTARPDRARGRLFKVHGLRKQIPSDLLHPKPSPEDDEEARIYVDVASLSKIGCFSGDWGYSQRPVTRIPSSRKGDRRQSFFESQVQRPSSPAAYASPILIANIDGATHLRISVLKKSSYQGKGTLPRFASASQPPYAKDIAIHHIRTPISAERAYQTAVLGGLKRYFAHKLRLVRQGDLIAVPVDAQLGRALQEAPGAGGSEVDDVVALTARSTESGGETLSHLDSVAWFKVGHIQVQKLDEDEDGTAESLWGTVACIDSTTVAMHGSGFETSRIPGIKDSTWPYYLGLKKTPQRAPDGGPPQLADRDQQHVPL
ncbi:hypothetical protein TrVFT333_009009 [Trichoderma virens FT-333]|nr:hypothetical protein TrVFT333_009009 [Trichoderma virens FT-333]